MPSPIPVVALAGGSGGLGFRIARALVARGAALRVLVRPDIDIGDERKLADIGATPIKADPGEVSAMAEALRGVDCVVSALSGLRPVIVERQGLLLDAAVAASVPRFIPSDYAADFTKTTPGENRNFDLRREFMARASAAPIAVTSILNGAFMDMLGAEMPIIQRSIRRVLYWRSADQPLDFTMKDDVASYTAAAALDPATPRILRFAGDTVTAKQIAAAMSEVEGRHYRTLGAGGIGALGLMIRTAKLVAPQPGGTFPPWQGMQYMRDMFSGAGRLTPIDNARYPDVRPTPVIEHLRAILR